MRILAPIQPLLYEALRNNSSYLIYPHKIPNLPLPGVSHQVHLQPWLGPLHGVSPVYANAMDTRTLPLTFEVP